MKKSTKRDLKALKNLGKLRVPKVTKVRFGTVIFREVGKNYVIWSWKNKHRKAEYRKTS